MTQIYDLTTAAWTPIGKSPLTIETHSTYPVAVYEGPTPPGPGETNFRTLVYTDPDGMPCTGYGSMVYARAISDTPRIAVSPFTPGASAEYLGQVATRSQFPNQRFPGTDTEVSLMGRSFHIARDDMDEVQIAVPNFYVRIYEGLFTEEGLGAPSEWMASVENLETGEFTQMLWGNASIGQVPDRSIGFTDMTPLKSRIDRGKPFCIRLWVHNAKCAPYYRTDNCVPGDAVELSGGRTVEKTMGGTITPSDALISLRPCGIMGRTTRPSIFMPMDSRGAGYGDTMDRTLDVGEVARSLGPSFGYINGGIPGDRLEFYKVNSELRRQMAPFCSHIVCNLAGNDIINTQNSEVQIATDLQTVWRLPNFAGRDISQTTISSFSAGSGSVDPRDMVRLAINNYIRSTPAPLARFFEIADINETYRDSGSNIDPYYTDAIHPNRLGYIHIQSAQRIRPELFTR